MISTRLSRFMASAMIVIMTTGLMAVSFDAEARRMGGGKSFGRQSSNVMQQRQAVTPPAATTAPRAAAPAAGAAASRAGATAQRSGMSRFLGPIAGIAAGLGIAALLSSMGLGGALLEFLSSAILIAAVVFGVLFLVRRLRAGAARPATQSAGSARSNNHLREANPASQQRPEWPSNSGQSAAGAAAVAPVAPAPEPVDTSWFIPADFDTPTFLANAKEQFIEIQALWDKGDPVALQEYLTDDLLKEATPQILEREGENFTEVVLLNAELLGIEKVADGYLASVRYSGMLREERDADAFRFEEVWNLYKQDNAGWLVAGIQQMPNADN